MPSLVKLNQQWAEHWAWQQNCDFMLSEFFVLYIFNEPSLMVTQFLLFDMSDMFYGHHNDCNLGLILSILLNIIIFERSMYSVPYTQTLTTIECVLGGLVKHKLDRSSQRPIVDIRDFSAFTVSNDMIWLILKVLNKYAWFTIHLLPNLISQTIPRD